MKHGLVLSARGFLIMKFPLICVLSHIPKLDEIFLNTLEFSGDCDKT